MTSATRPVSTITTTNWQRELAAGLIVGVIGIPMAMAPGVLLYTPLGPDFVADGAAAGLYGAIISGAIAALIGTSSFVITIPRASPALVLATLIAALLINPAFAGNPPLVLAMAALCVFLAGLWQILFGVFRIARIIKFTPHPVFAGFLNGAAMLIVDSQLKPFFIDPTSSVLLMPDHPMMLVLVICLGLLVVFYQRLIALLRLPAGLAKAPGAIVAFAAGIAIFYAIKWLSPASDVGPLLGEPDISLASPLLHLWNGKNAALVWSVSWNVVLISLVLAIVATMETLMVLRTAQNMADIKVHPVRELSAQGVGNCAAAILAPIPSAASPGMQAVAFRSGGRTRLTGLVAAAVILTVGIGFSDAVAVVPHAVLSAVLVGTGLAMIDMWSIRLLSRIVRNTSPHTRRRDLMDLVVVIAVTGITAMTTVVIGVLSGCLLAVLIFVINMSRPVVRRSYFGNEIFSKRTRSTTDIAILQKAGHRHAVLQLEGVLFFGNAEDLSRMAKDLFETTDTVIFDMRAITDIDASGSTILGNLIARSRQQKKRLLFCNVAPEQTTQVRGLFDRPESADAAIKIDLETALEWVEEEILRASLDERSRSALMPLEEIDFLAGVSEQEMTELRKILKLRKFEAGDTICREGDLGDRMWLLVKGSVSVRLDVADHRGSRRIASLGRGTVVGEMALIEGAPRSASIIADEAVTCYELSGDDFNLLLRDSPVVAAHVMRNTARELARRLRRTSEDLRHAAS